MGHPDQQPTFEEQQLETPCLVIDASIMQANIRRMAEAVQRLGVRLRPHAKTHKIPEFAAAQIAAGAAASPWPKFPKRRSWRTTGLTTFSSLIRSSPPRKWKELCG
ncbi:hypothetical protein [Gordoniibacillus kamchatkensis]|uniref:hypothetical protein n=1 Tax=Gordoniibacillus kamchatkensis TaxID=1590651 RepID=UPI000AFFE20C|nr:hypothetical protein [Paenibacillus sp. VKM B-2647]